MPVFARPDRVVFRFAGPDAQKLLNDVLTGRIPSKEGPAVWWALLTPQGKILAEGLAGFAENALWLDVAASVADDFFRRMRMYKLRADMTIENLRESHRVGWSPEPLGTGIVHEDPRAGGLGYRVIATAEANVEWLPDGREFARRRIAAGVAELGPDFEPDSHFAHDVGMDLLEGIDFIKGCYVGQEVVSRMKHRGTARRRPVLVSGIAGASGATVTAGGREAGTLGIVVDGRAVGILRLDRITDPQAAEVEGKPVQLALPAWAGYAFGESVSEET